MKNVIENFSALFKKNTTKQLTPMQNSESTFTPQSEIEENLFIEKDEPVITESVTQRTPESKLSSFLRLDFQTKGHTDGYRYHSADVLDNGKRIIRSEFREIIEKMIDERKASLSQLHQHIVSIRDISSKEAEKINVRISEFNDEVAKLEQEKELSSMDEGMLAKTLHLYRDGFIRGVADYNEETLLLTNTGIF